MMIDLISKPVNVAVSELHADESADQRTDNADNDGDDESAGIAPRHDQLGDDASDKPRTIQMSQPMSIPLLINREGRSLAPMAPRACHPPQDHRYRTCVIIPDCMWYRL